MVQRATAFLETAGIRYAVVGSVASSVHGEPRYARNVDILAEAALAQTSPIVNVIVSKNRPFDRSRLERRVLLAEAGFYLVTPEDELLARLEHPSHDGWRDVEGIVAVQPALDRDYLEHWAQELAVSDLLARVLPKES